LQDVADRCGIAANPTLQVYKDAMMVKDAENPTSEEVEDLLEEFGDKY
jgi:hypothetical protein